MFGPKQRKGPYCVFSHEIFREELLKISAQTGHPLPAVSSHQSEWQSWPCRHKALGLQPTYWRKRLQSTPKTTATVLRSTPAWPKMKAKDLKTNDLEAEKLKQLLEDVKLRNMKKTISKTKNAKK